MITTSFSVKLNANRLWDDFTVETGQIREKRMWGIKQGEIMKIEPLIKFTLCHARQKTQNEDFHHVSRGNLTLSH